MGSTAKLFDATVSADMAMTDLLGGGGSGEELADFAVEIETITPGLGNLLVTLQYFDGQATQQLNVSLNLTAGGMTEVAWPNLWQDLSQPRSMQLTYLGGIVSGTARVQLLFRN